MSQEQSQAVEPTISPSIGTEFESQGPSYTIPHADRVITVFGVTGAIGNLINICPIPEEDKANFTQEQVDSYVDKLIAMDETPKEEEVEPETEETELEESKKKLI
mgnify:CR=1 FL=1